MNRRRTAALAGGVAAVLALGVALAGLPGGSAKAADAERPGLGSAEVTRRTLVEQESFDGTLGHGDAVPVVNRRSGTLTWMAPAGSTVDRGRPLYEVDGRKVPLLFGDRPAWRPLGPGVTGPDVRQLEENLVALGFANAHNLDVDDTWTPATTDAVKRWQKAAGVDQTGVVDLGDAVFLPGAVIVASQTGHVGENAMPGGGVLTATPAAPVVTVKLDAAKRDLVAAGDTVDIELPGDRRIPGTVISVGTDAAGGSGGSGGSGSGGGGGGGGDPQVEMTVRPDGSTDGLDGSPVSVDITRQKAENVLAVPVEALLALAEGGYGVETQADHRLVPVQTGLFADGQVEVSGPDLRPGLKVVVPQ